MKARLIGILTWVLYFDLGLLTFGEIQVVFIRKPPNNCQVKTMTLFYIYI